MDDGLWKPMKHSFLWRTTLMVLIFPGCVSRYYWGANLHADGRALVRPVPRRLDREMRDLARSCVEHLLRGDVDGIDRVATSDLRNEMAGVHLDVRLREIANKYGLIGKYDQINSTGGGWWLDETISKDPYRLYDFFITEFNLRGESDAHAFLVIGREGDGFSLMGFDIHSADHKAETPDLSFMPPRLRGWTSLKSRG